jgi:hypothetical protein
MKTTTSVTSRAQSPPARFLAMVLNLSFRVALFRPGLITCLIAIGLGTSPGAMAATQTVSSLADSGAGSLRAAIGNANMADIVDATGVSGKILLTTGEISITNSITILGPGPGTLAVDGNANSRIFTIYRLGTTPISVFISGLTVTNGFTKHRIGLPTIGEAGGGIFNDQQTLTVSNVTVIGNKVDPGELNGIGGGICNGGFDFFASLRVIDCTIASNSAAFGGGIFNTAIQGGHSEVRVLNSTFNGNTAGTDGGGIYNNVQDTSVGGPSVGIVALTNCTLTGNLSPSVGALINFAVNSGSAFAQIAHSTFSGNSGPGGIGVYNVAGQGPSISRATVEVGHTIFNRGSNGFCFASGASGSSIATVIDRGYNLVSDLSGSGILTNTTDQLHTDPVLGPLQDNGGPTFTHAITTNSPAWNKGDPNFVPPPDFDQRGPDFLRLSSCALDIGAYELQITNVCNNPPVAVCTNVIVAAGSYCTASASVDGGSYDPDDGDTIDITQTPPGPYDLGTNAVLLTVTDSHGESNSCLATVLVVDITRPTILSCPAATTNSADANCQAAIPNVLAGLIASDNCTAAGSLSKSQLPTNGTLVGLGTHQITVSVRDAAGNSNGCVTTFTVVDTIPPGITCPGNITTTTDAGKCTAKVTFAPTVTDNCGATTVCTPPSGSTFAIGTTTVLCTASDASGNSSSCTFKVTVGVGNKCPLSQGYWKNHPELWAANSLTLGSVTYNKTQLLSIMNNSTISDASIILAKQLIAALFNQANGSTPVPICGVIAHANSLLGSAALPCNINTKSTLGKALLADATTLEGYNLGKLTPGCTP